MQNPQIVLEQYLRQKSLLHSIEIQLIFFRALLPILLHLHTLMPTLIVMPTTTSAPTDVHNSCIGDCFSILIESTLVDQGT